MTEENPTPGAGWDFQNKTKQNKKSMTGDI